MTATARRLLLAAFALMVIVGLSSELAARQTDHEAAQAFLLAVGATTAIVLALYLDRALGTGGHGGHGDGGWEPPPAPVEPPPEDHPVDLEALWALDAVEPVRGQS